MLLTFGVAAQTPVGLHMNVKTRQDRALENSTGDRDPGAKWIRLVHRWDVAHHAYRSALDERDRLGAYGLSWQVRAAEARTFRAFEQLAKIKHEMDQLIRSSGRYRMPPTATVLVAAFESTDALSPSSGPVAEPSSSFGTQRQALFERFSLTRPDPES